MTIRQSLMRESKSWMLCACMSVHAMLTGCAADGAADQEDTVETATDLDGHALSVGVPAQPGDHVPGEPALSMTAAGESAASDDADKRLYSAHPFSRVTSSSSAPAKMTAQLVTTYPNGIIRRCSGTVVGKDSVLTAAHCVFNTSRGGWARTIEVTPGRVDDGLPFGRTWGRQLFVSQTYRTRDAAGEGTKSEVDYAIIRTHPMQNTSVAIGDKVGTLSLSTVNPTSSALNWSLKFFGYPDTANPSFMYTSSDKVRSTFSSGIFTHQASSLDGLSGAAALNGSNVIFGLHVGEAPDSNYGLLITSGIRTNLTDWMSR